MGELALLTEVGLPQVPGGDPVDALPESAASPVGVEVVEVRPESLERLRDGLADPGGPMDPVRDAEDRPFDDGVPRVVRGLRVQVADGVGAAGETEREGGHVELVRVTVDTQPELQDIRHRDATRVEERASHSPDEVGVEALVTR